MAHEKHSNSLLFRALDKHSCSSKYYRKITGIITLGGTLPVFDSLFLERLSQGRHCAFCFRSQVEKDLFYVLPPPPYPSLSLFLIPCHSLTSSCQLTQMAGTVNAEVEKTVCAGTLWVLFLRCQKKGSLGFKLHHFCDNKEPMEFGFISRITEKISIIKNQ